MRRFLVLLVLSLPLCPAQDLLQILSGELTRNFTALRQKADPAPYFMAYEVTSDESESLAFTLGALTARGSNHGRYFDVTVRVGTPKLDNYHVVRGQFPRFTSGAAIPLDNVAPAIRQRVWLDTDRAYRLAAQRLIQIQSDDSLKVASADQSADFSSEPTEKFTGTIPKLKVPMDAWEPVLRKASATLGASPGVLSSTVYLSIERRATYFVNTEGTHIAQGRLYCRIVINAAGKTEDGMNLESVRTFEAADPSHLPKPAEIESAAQAVGNELASLTRAPVIDPYVGPAILSGRAAGVFFHEIFGHRVEGFRQKSEDEGQTFTKSVGKPVLPDFLSVVFDATRKTIGDTDLNGSYDYDDEGVKARPVTVVDHGILKTFLLSRMPIQGFDHSNGHGRRQPGHEVMARQSNLIVESSRQVSDAELRKMLIDEVKRQNKPYGLYFKDITGGFTLTQRAGLQAFTVIPLVVYRVYPDGRPDELIRGVSIVGTPLASFGKILATSDHSEVFNGYCGAESGTVPVSAVSPALLLGEIEVQKSETSSQRPPLLPRPTETQP